MASGPAVFHITKDDNVLKGQRRRFAIVVTDNNGNRQQMSGWTMIWRLYAYRGAATPLVTISGANISFDSTLSDATLDKVIVLCDNNTLDDAPIGKLYHKASRTDNDNEGDVVHGDFWLLG